MVIKPVADQHQEQTNQGADVRAQKQTYVCTGINVQ